MSTEAVVIVGTGLAGYSTAKEFRKHDKQTPLIIVSGDGGYSYSKPMLSNALGRGQAPDDLPNGDVVKMSETLDADIRANCEVTSLSVAERSIECDGRTLEFGKLVLALGARQRRLPFAGDATDDVLSINDLEQYAAFRQALEGARRVAIIGAGLIGSEFANDLMLGGFSVDVIEPFPHPLGRLVPEEAGTLVRDALSAMGVRWHLGQTCEQVDRSTQGYRLTLSDGASVEADVVLSAVGLMPRTEMASAAGLGVNEAITVDRNLETSASGIYSLGDCMEVEGLVLPYIMPIMHAARALGKTLAGETTRLSYPVMPVVVKTPAHPVVVSPPPRGAEGEWQVEAAADGVKAMFVVDDVPVGFTLTGSRMPEKNALVKELPPVLP